MPATVTKNDHIKGADSAAITLIEYGDFECPFCARAHEALTSLLPQYGDDVRLVYRHMPLDGMHPDATPAAEAAEAAGAQGKFWEMHDALFAGQDDLSDQAFQAMAQDIGLDGDRFEDDLQSGKYAQIVASDAAEARHCGVRGTPTFYINGVQFEGDSDVQSLEQAINAALEK
ncbi:DsbA family protein [Massilia sp. S19_KUP03_FR1]|uniref:DsbA family protein n=1 Tax=Massilia sp. S19_KUP03_FR1 TaxID=3025503 RepID=UPI002FCD4279